MPTFGRRALGPTSGIALVYLGIWPAALPTLGHHIQPLHWLDRSPRQTTERWRQGRSCPCGRLPCRLCAHQKFAGLNDRLSRLATTLICTVSDVTSRVNPSIESKENS